MRHDSKNYHAAYVTSTGRVVVASSEQALRNKIGGGPDSRIVLGESIADAIHRAHQLAWDIGDRVVRVPCPCTRCREAK